MENKKDLFLNEVTNQIKAKEAKKYVADELGYHLKEAKNSWMEKGLTEIEAENKAVEQMGSPTILGKQLNKLHKPKIDWLLLVLLVTIFGLGFLPMFSLGYMDEKHFLINKTITVLLGGAAALGIMLLDYRKWKNLGWLFYTAGLLILIGIRVFSNTTINGVPLLRIPFIITIESSMALPFFFLAWATFFNNERLKVWQFVLLFLIPFLLFFTAQNIPTTFIYTVMVFVMLWWSKFSQKTIMLVSGLTGGLLLTLGIITLQNQVYQRERLLAFLNPEKYSNGAGFMVLRIKEIMSKAGWFGNPMDQEFIPDAHTNFVFVTFTYYYGWLLAIGLVFILSLFAARIIVVTSETNDSYGRLLLIGAVALYTVQLVCNICMAFGFFPPTAMSLPFISYGLMPTIFNAILIGVVLSVYRRKDFVSTRFS